MRITILGGGWYGCHLAAALCDSFEVSLLEKAPRLFNGASGSNPARLHIGPHYPRSRETRLACQSHSEQFLKFYGKLTRGIGRNLYAVATHDSLVDFGNYVQTLRQEIDLLRVHDPAEFQLANVDGAIIVAERHILIDKAREYFATLLGNTVTYNAPAARPPWPPLDDELLIDCTFCSNDAEGVDRYEPCLTVLMEGPTDQAVTIMDGPFPSLYPWREDANLCSLTSAKYTPLARYTAWDAADRHLREIKAEDIADRTTAMIEQMAFYYPPLMDTHRRAGELLSIRAMPRSGADSRLVQVLHVARNHLRIRAGKIDAIFEAERQVIDRKSVV